MAKVIKFPNKKIVSSKLPQRNLPDAIQRRRDMRQYLHAVADHMQNSSSDFDDVVSGLRTLAKIHMNDKTFWMLKSLVAQYDPKYLYDAPFDDDDADLIGSVVLAIRSL